MRVANTPMRPWHIHIDVTYAPFSLSHLLFTLIICCIFFLYPPVIEAWPFQIPPRASLSLSLSKSAISTPWFWFFLLFFFFLPHSHWHQPRSDGSEIFLIKLFFICCVSPLNVIGVYWCMWRKVYAWEGLWQRSEQYFLFGN